MITPITMDGITYRVRLVYDSMVLSFELLEGPNEGTMLSGYHERDLQGTKYGHSMKVEPDPTFPEDFDAFFHALSAPVNSHHVELPYGQVTIAYDAEIQDGEVTYGGKLLGKNRWHGLTVNYIPIEPQREPEDDEP